MKKPSSLWTLVPWILPGWAIPPWVWEKVERSVYDGMTRHEWFQAQVAELQAMNRRQASQPSSETEETKR